MAKAKIPQAQARNGPINAAATPPGYERPLAPAAGPSRKARFRAYPSC